MSAWVYLPLALSLVLSALSQPLARRLSPRTATPALVLTTMLVAAGTTWGLVLIAATLLHEAPPVAEHAVGGPSAVEPVPAIIATTALVLLSVGLYRMVATLNRQLRTHRVLRGLCGHPGVGELVVLADDQLGCSGRTGRLVTGTYVEGPGRVEEFVMCPDSVSEGPSASASRPVLSRPMVGALTRPEA